MRLPANGIMLCMYYNMHIDVREYYVFTIGRITNRHASFIPPPLNSYINITSRRIYHYIELLIKLGTDKYCIFAVQTPPLSTCGSVCVCLCLYTCVTRSCYFDDLASFSTIKETKLRQLRQLSFL